MQDKWQSKRSPSPLGSFIVGLGFLAALWWATGVVLQEWFVTRWPRIPSRIISIDLGIVNARPGQAWFAAPSVEYEYQVAHKRYKSSRIAVSPFNYLREAALQRDLGHLRVGDRLFCSINPANPREAYLINSGITILPTASMLVSLAGLLWIAIRFAWLRFYLTEMYFIRKSRHEITKAIGNGARVNALGLSRCEVTKHEIDAINRCHNLRYLKLSDCNITNEVVRQLTIVPQLIELHLDGNPIDDVSAHVLASGRLLNSLVIARTKIGDEGLTEIGNLTHIECLDISETNISDRSIPRLVGLSVLHSICMAATAIGDESIERIVGMNSLRRLDVSYTKITDASVPHLSRLHWHDDFCELDITGTKLSSDSVAELRQQLPLATVKWENRQGQV